MSARSDEKTRRIADEGRAGAATSSIWDTAFWPITPIASVEIMLDELRRD